MEKLTLLERFHHWRLVQQDKSRGRGFIGIQKDGDKYYKHIPLLKREGYWWHTEDGRKIHSRDIVAIEDRTLFGYSWGARTEDETG